MPAYLLAQIEVTDPALFAEYSARVPDVVRAHGGRYVIRGGTAEPLEGEPPQRVVLLEFPTGDAARAFWDSDAYAPLKALRQRASVGSLAILPAYE